MVKALSVLTEDPGSVPTTHSIADIGCKTRSSGPDALSWPLLVLHALHRHPYTLNKVSRSFSKTKFLGKKNFQFRKLETQEH